jgi:hypothetical protein
MDRNATHVSNVNSLEISLTNYGANNVLKFLIKADSYIHALPIDDIKIISIGIKAWNSDSSLTTWRKDVSNIRGIV